MPTGVRVNLVIRLEDDEPFIICALRGRSDGVARAERCGEVGGIESIGLETVFVDEAVLLQVV